MHKGILVNRDEIYDQTRQALVNRSGWTMVDETMQDLGGVSGNVARSRLEMLVNDGLAIRDNQLTPRIAVFELRPDLSGKPQGKRRLYISSETGAGQRYLPMLADGNRNAVVPVPPAEPELEPEPEPDPGSVVAWTMQTMMDGSVRMSMEDAIVINEGFATGRRGAKR
jgi:hypothetical protein